ncbi:MAG: hypothetical protein HOV66_26240 [Streptomycetaceae bacterium]|nr:hypothetical protein [Streptomycetaceae bacterium]
MTEAAAATAISATAIAVGVPLAFDYRNCAIHADQWLQSYKYERRPDVPRPTLLRWAGGGLAVFGVVELVVVVCQLSGF